ncbi:MAG: hypothetical protein A2340_11260 [Lentisphaerae bacterium RIFOXYB12_FULL_60_10]|nr:MAG: hypothetical protein A2340_11260 [Lentisphaerae bacterium RIFOXYB12_FULL_60_10]
MDFVKIDVDGADFDILSASSCLFKDMSILGVKVEINYVGSDAPTENTFHNTDRLMRQSGYELVDLDVRRYSLRELPAPFVYRAPFHTKLGAPFQGDAVYARDVSWVPRGDDSYVAAKLLKLACVYEIAGVSDWAASLLIRNKSRLGKYCDVSALLDLLAQDKMSGVQGYNGFMQAFEHQPELLYPSAADEYCDRCRNRSKGSVLKVLIRRFVKACRKIYSAIPRVFS